MDADPRADARRALEKLRDASLCGSCRTDYVTMLDALEKDGEFEKLMREYVAIEARHPHASHLPERAAEISAARDEAARRVGGPAAAPPAAAPEPKSAPMVGVSPGDFRGVVRSWRDTIGGAIPRPFGILPGPKRRT